MEPYEAKAALHDLGPRQALNRLPGENYKTDFDDVGRWESARELAKAQARDLNKIVNMLDRTGMPIADLRIEPRIPTWFDAEESDAARTVAKAAARFVASVRTALGPDRAVKPQASEYSSYWGLNLAFESGMTYGYQIYNEVTCDQVEVVDEHGEPELVEEVRSAGTVTVMVPKTVRRCINLFEQS
jgi:hypothetical protein